MSPGMMTFVNGQGVKVSDHEAILGRAALVKKMLPPQNVPVGQLARETGIPKDTLYTWRAKYRQASGVSIPAHDRLPERLQHRGQVCGGVGDSGSERSGAERLLPAQGPVCRADRDLEAGVPAGQRAADGLP